MTAEIAHAVRNILLLDGTVSVAEIEHALAILDGRPADHSDLPRILRAKDVARLLGKSTAFVHQCVKSGCFDTVRGSGDLTLGITVDSYVRFCAAHRSMKRSTLDRVTPTDRSPLP